MKNSLQVVSSLVAMQRGVSKDENVRAALGEVASRLDTISLVHEELHLVNAAMQVDLGRYLERLGTLLGGNAPAGVEVIVSAPLLITDSRGASSIGMIVSEFVANSLKHAFPGARAGAIRISLHRLADGRAELVCEDDGVGAQAADAGGRRGLGLRIIDALVSQIGGRMEQRPGGPGVQLRIIFPPADPSTGDTSAAGG